MSIEATKLRVGPITTSALLQASQAVEEAANNAPKVSFSGETPKAPLTPEEEEELRKKRASRFSGESPAGAGVATLAGVSEKDRLKARKEKFGIFVPKNDEEKAKQRTARFGQVQDIQKVSPLLGKRSANGALPHQPPARQQAKQPNQMQNGQRFLR
eukprot:GGOE01044281.1.p1 GENE.GGOE01044281.1~~GGOE01044281.1.p1  ORF type:complete len:157 (-),score=33.16 GGOE01044281.1:235-705(-)